MEADRDAMKMGRGETSGEQEEDQSWFENLKGAFLVNGGDTEHPPTMAAWAGHVVSLKAADVEVCFYQYLMPLWARGYFCLPQVDASHLPPDIRRATGCAQGLARFRVKVVPIGWAWAVHYVQAAHLHLMSRTLEPSTDPAARDKLLHLRRKTEQQLLLLRRAA